MDPFYENTQIAHFKSSYFFESELQGQNDTIISSAVQSTMGKKRDNKFKTYIWTQLPNKLVRSSVLKAHNGKIQNDDSEEGNERSDKEDEEEIIGKFSFEATRMVMNERDFIYYITKKNGQCYINEDNPRDQYLENHAVIY